MPLTPVLVAAALATLSSGYVWPNPQLDALESMRVDQFGYAASVGGSLIAGGLTPCNKTFFPSDTPGRSNAADWIRNVFHDAAPHNQADGTGGLDASIRFEISRSENVGTTFSNSATFLPKVANRYVSVADVYALAGAASVELCGGPHITYRGGRVDATGPNTPGGVPEPFQTLDDHTSAFARMGFNQTEMIGLIACGHSLGGVQRKFFPTIVPPADPNNPDADINAPFDSSVAALNLDIPKEYDLGTTKNPLVVGPNVTTNSDLRIFSSDGNATMKAFLASPPTFVGACQSLFTRLINTVPSNVVLTDPIEPLSVKPQGVEVTPLVNGSFALRGQVRFLDMVENPSRVIKINWADRSGNACSSCNSTLGHTVNQASSSVAGGTVKHTSLWYSFNQTATHKTIIDPVAGISKFWFTVIENGTTTTYDQGGIGFAVQDALLLTTSSCVTPSKSGFTLSLKIAVRTDVLPAQRIFLETDTFDQFGNPQVTTTPLTFPPAGQIGPTAVLDSAPGPYTFLSTRVPLPQGNNMNIAAIAKDGSTIRGPYGSHWDTALPRC